MLTKLERDKRAAINVATLAHRGQLDKGGQPYIYHPLAVGDSLESEGIVAQIVGYLHDTIEDTYISYQDIYDYFNFEVAEAVLSVTRLDPAYNHRLPSWAQVTKKENYFDFVRRAKLNPIGRIVKIADIKHNTSPARMANLSEEEKGVIHRYNKALEFLNGNS